MPDLSKVLLDRLDRIEKELARLRNQDRAPKALIIRDGVTAPSAVTAIALIYVDTADGNLKVKFANGSITTLGGGSYTDEQAQDAIGAMVSGNTETGIAVTYDDAGNKLNFDAQTAGDARYSQKAVVIGARVYNNANLSINNVTTTALTFNSELFDTDNLHSTSSNTDRLTAPVTGTYLITGHLSFAANATGLRFVEIVLNAGATPIAVSSHDAIDDGSNAEIVSIATIYQLAAADYVRLRVYQDSGGALNVLRSANYSPEFAMVLLSS